MAAPVKPLAAAETAVRRFLLMVGFGFAAFVGGSVLAYGLAARLAARLDGANATVQWLMFYLVDGMWVLLVLPGLAYLAARFLEVRPWPTALVGAATGVTFQLALQYVSMGAEGLMADPLRQVSRAIAVACGVVVTALAARKGRQLAKVAEEKAAQDAEKKKTQYDDFVRQAQALAERREQVPISSSATTPVGTESGPGSGTAASGTAASGTAAAEAASESEPVRRP